jgi:DNA polymerase-3 subunit gamma/tau
MAYIALYRKWRPLKFEDVVEQEYVVQALKNTILNSRVGHAYLFCGTRGTGKTTMAKIFSRAINCIDSQDGNPCNQCDICKGILDSTNMDVIEIDAASNNSVDNVRDIRDEVIYTPSVSKYKVYIIDEVHMLSTGAFNALLKTLEEPPSHVVFILATTEPHKLPVTILSRCQRFDFRRIPVASIQGRIVKIADSTNCQLDSEAAKLIATLADGAMRDGISILEQCIAFNAEKITFDDVLMVVGMVSNHFTANLVDLITSKNVKGILEEINELVMQGKDLKQFISELILYYRNILISKNTDNPEKLISTNKETLNIIIKQGQQLDLGQVIQIIKDLSLLESNIKWSTQPRILLETGLIKLCEEKFNFDSEQDELFHRLQKLENQIKNGALMVAPAAASSTKPALNEQAKSTTEPKYTLKEGTGVEPEYIEFWDEVIFDTKKHGKVFLFTSLLNSKAISLGGNKIGIILAEDYKINKDRINNIENKDYLQNLIKEKVGFEVRVKCIDSDKVQEHLGSIDKTEENLFKKIENVAKQHNIEVNIVDE